MEYCKIEGQIYFTLFYRNSTNQKEFFFGRTAKTELFKLDKEKDASYSQKKVDKHFFIHTSLGGAPFVPHVYLVAEMVIRIE